jgi:hypothetical protein
MVYMDLTYHLLQSSTLGNWYLLVVYEYDSNYIHDAPMSTRTGPSIITAYNRAFKLLEAGGFNPILQRLDNELSRTTDVHV